MKISEEKRAQYARQKWAVYVPKEHNSDKERIMAALTEQGHPFKPVMRCWQGPEVEMLDIPFAAAEYVADNFPLPHYTRIICRHFPMKGWKQWFEESTKANPLKPFGTNNNVFRLQHADRVSKDSASKVKR